MELCNFNLLTPSHPKPPPPSNHFLSLKCLSVSRINPGWVYLGNFSVRATSSQYTSTVSSQYFVEDHVARNWSHPAVKNSNVGSETSEKEATEDTPTDEQRQTFEFLDKLDVNFYSKLVKISTHVEPERLPEQRVFTLLVLSALRHMFSVLGTLFSIIGLFFSSKSSKYVEPERLAEQQFYHLDSDDTSSVLLLGGGSLIAVWIAIVLVGAIDSIPLFPKLMEAVGLAYTLWFSTRYLLFKNNREELIVRIEEIKQQVLGSPKED